MWLGRGYEAAPVLSITTAGAVRCGEVGGLLMRLGGGWAAGRDTAHQGRVLCRGQGSWIQLAMAEAVGVGECSGQGVASEFRHRVAASTGSAWRGRSGAGGGKGFAAGERLGREVASVWRQGRLRSASGLGIRSRGASVLLSALVH